MKKSRYIEWAEAYDTHPEKRLEIARKSIAETSREIRQILDRPFALVELVEPVAFASVMLEQLRWTHGQNDPVYEISDTVIRHLRAKILASRHSYRMAKTGLVFCHIIQGKEVPKWIMLIWKRQRKKNG